jgi:predicted nucleic acid-binding protein
VIRVVADTNVYVSAIVFGGTGEAILAPARAGVVDLFISPAIRRELRFVLGHTFGWAASQVREALAEVDALASLARPSI